MPRYKTFLDHHTHLLDRMKTECFEGLRLRYTDTVNGWHLTVVEPDSYFYVEQRNLLSHPKNLAYDLSTHSMTVSHLHHRVCCSKQ